MAAILNFTLGTFSWNFNFYVLNIHFTQQFDFCYSQYLICKPHEHNFSHKVSKNLFVIALKFKLKKSLKLLK